MTSPSGGRLPAPPVPDVASATTLVAAPGAGPGHWAGAPSAVPDRAQDGAGFWLAYRVRHPVAQGRGFGVVLARYSGDGEPVAVGAVHRDDLGAESLERPALVRRPDGGWRLYVSCATRGSKHWWVEALDADTVEGLPAGRRSVVFAGDERTGVKDPVVVHDAVGWHAWVCCHPLDVAGEEDRMWTAYSRSGDGLVWTAPQPVLAPAAQEPGVPARWDARGTRVTAVLPGPTTFAYYDGRIDAAQNWYEVTGGARGAPGAALGGPLRPTGSAPLALSPVGTHALRYVCVVADPRGGYRLFFEASRADGAHDLMVQRVGVGAGASRPTARFPY